MLGKEKMKKSIYDAKTGKTTMVDLTSDELAFFKLQQEQDDEKRLEAEQVVAEKQAKLESAKAKLTALGLDEAEVNAILGL